jgi:hypothetical protein
LKGLDKPPATQEERQDRAQSLGPRLWKAQHVGNVSSANEGSFLIFLWNVKSDAIDYESVGFQVTKSRTVEKLKPENVTGKVTAAKIDGMGDPDRVYRVSTSGVSTSLMLPVNAITEKTLIIVCREGKNGVYPNTTSAKEGHAISSETIAWYLDLPGKDKFRILIPFLS